MSDMLAAALAYARRGWHVFPVVDGDKNPSTKHGHLDATTDEMQITAWWTGRPTERIGVYLRASGLIAIDVDPRNGGDATLRDLEAHHGPLPRDLNQRSGGDGEHVIMRDPSPGPEGWTRPGKYGGRLRGNFGQGSGVDIKCNGYVVLAPSANGAYRWLSFGDAPDVPPRWIDLLRKPDAEIHGEGIEAWEASLGPLSAADDASLHATLDELVKLGRGTGNNTTFCAVANIFHNYGLGLEDGIPYLNDWNSRCGKPHTATNLERQLGSIAARNLSTQGERGHLRDTSAITGMVHEHLRNEQRRSIAMSASANVLGHVARGFDLDATIAAHNAAQKAAPAPTPTIADFYGPDLLSFLGDDDPGDDAQAWLVRGVIARGVPQFIAGTPKSRKTWIMEHVAICIAAGIPWLDRFATTRGRVLILPREDSLRETRRRIWRLARGLGLDPRSLSDNLRVDSALPFYFSSPEDVARMHRTLEAWRPDLIMIDSLSRTHMCDENSKKEMAIVTAVWGDLCQRYDVAIPIVHHLTKSGDGPLLQRLRGTGDLGALARHLIGVEKKSPSTSALSFEGNLPGAPEPFVVEFIDETTAQGKPAVRLRYVDSEQRTDSARIDAEIIAVVGRHAPRGCTARDVEENVTGKNERIRKRRDALVDDGQLRQLGGRYHLGLGPTRGTV